METELDVVDLEEYAKNGKTPPKAKAYRFRVDRDLITVQTPVLKGRRILELAQKNPPDRFKLFQHLRGGKTVPVGLDDDVDLRTPGVERFKTLPIDPVDGLAEPRRQFQMPEADSAFLERFGLRWETIVAEQVKWLIIYGYPVPKGYNVDAADMALRIDAQYPVAQIDMAYFSPALARKDGGPLANLSTLPALDGRPWQQWSRHRTSQNPWRPGVDDLETHLLLVDHWLQHDVAR
jgi:hypothetical protein